MLPKLPIFSISNTYGFACERRLRSKIFQIFLAFYVTFLFFFYHTSIVSNNTVSWVFSQSSVWISWFRISWRFQKRKELDFYHLSAKSQKWFDLILQSNIYVALFESLISKLALSFSSHCILDFSNAILSIKQGLW